MTGRSAALEGGYVKRDDLTSPVYGGNKVRTLEAWFGQARRDGRSWVYSTGAYGSNHAVATVLHGRRAGFKAGVLLFPQPFSRTARENLEVSATCADEVVDLWHWSSLPLGMWRTARRHGGARGRALVMPPGGATPRGALGFLSAALEVGLQVQAGVLPRPDEIVLALGSTCSTAGLLVGLHVASRLGLGLRGPGASGGPPALVAVRVTPWPVTSPWRVLGLAERTARWLYALSGDRTFDIERRELARTLHVEGGFIGSGYGCPTPGGLEAIRRLEPFSSALDTTYSAKSAAALLSRAERAPGRTRLFWSTKSGAPLPRVTTDALERLPPRMRRWLGAHAPDGQRSDG